jgi:hypothetical protein
VNSPASSASTIEPSTAVRARSTTAISPGSSFECSVCGLVLNGYDELIVEEMADQLVVEGSRDPVAYFGLQY